MRTIRVYIAALILVLFGMTQLFYGCASQPGTTKGSGQAQTSAMKNINAVYTSESADTVNVVIAADGPLTFSSLKKPNPPAVLFIFPETSVAELPAEQMVKNPIVQRIVASDGNGGRTARLEFMLTEDMPYSAAKDGNNVVLTFNKMASARAPEVAAASTPASEAPATAPAVETDNNPAVATKTSAPAPVYVPKSTAWVNKIDFLSETQGRSTLVVRTTHPINYQVNKVSPQKIEIRLLNTRIPSYRQRALITTRFTSAVDRIVPYQHAKTANESVISVELREAVPYVAEQTDNLLMVHFESSSVPPKPLEQAQLPAWKRAALNDDRAMMSSGPSAGAAAGPDMGQQANGASSVQPYLADQAQQATSAPVFAPSEAASSLFNPKKLYTGEKIAIDFYDTDVKNVFRILREVSGKNFAIDKNVSGKVTMTLEKPVPWDQVLDLVLRMNQLGLIYEGDIVRIATLETLKKEDDLRRSKLESMRKAQEEARALEPLVTKYIPVSYSDAASEVVPHLEKILTSDRGTATVDSKNNQVIITDTASVVQQAQEIVRRIDRVTSQVLIEARVVEVSDSFVRNLGITWGGSYGPGSIPGTGINTTADMAINLPSAAANTFGINFSRLSGVPFVLNAQLDAAETTGEGRILSSPKILTLDNKKAQIKQGLEYPYFERSSDGGASTKFKNIDLLLEVTPHVTPDNRVSMKIRITKNDVAALVGIDQVPSVATNEAETELLVNDGDTIVIGGIIKATENSGQNAVPALSKIPILGWLFKNSTTSHQKNELLIFISPSIVKLEQAGN